jgi:photosystem II stability/assembly factor-like uncharacterized protein
MEGVFAMRFAAAIFTLLGLVSPVLPATLHAIHFIDANEGWIVGDDGVIEHTLDGGTSWERQSSGTKASLRSVVFLDEATGWAVGREEKPYGGGSVAVVLFTRDGGVRWQRLLDNSLPGLNAVRFTDRKNGFLLGDGQDPFASGIFRTRDGGKSWEPVKGTRAAWAAGDFQDGKNGVLVGPWGKLATFRNEQWAVADPVTFGGRGLRAVQILKKKLIAVGDGGLVLTSISDGNAWAHADLGLPAGARACLDFNALAAVGERIWIAGRPGSVIFRSDDNGATWAIKKVRPQASSSGPGQLPILALQFLDKSRGFAVGVGGFILATSDGGDTWREIRGGAQPQILIAHAQAKDAAFDAVAYLRSAERVTPPLVVSMTTEGANQISLGNRLHQATKAAGGFGAEHLTGFLLPQYLQAASQDDLVSAWNGVHGNAPQEMLRRLALLLRMWQPLIVIMEDPSAPGATGLLAEAMKEAVKRAEDPAEFAEQIGLLGLQPASPLTQFALSEKGSLFIDTSIYPQHADGAPRDIGALAHGYVSDRPRVFPTKRPFHFLGYGAAAHAKGDLPQTPALTWGAAKVNRPAQEILELAQTTVEREKNERTIRQIVNLVDRLPRTEVVLGQLLPLLKGLPEDDAARAGFAVANAYVRMGEWDLARETFLLMVDRAPAHPLSAEAYRWLVQHNVSSELRRRYELQHFAVVHQDNSRHLSIAKTNVRPNFDLNAAVPDKLKPAKGGEKFDEGIQQTSAVATAADMFDAFAPKSGIRQWSRGALEFNKRFEMFGTLATVDPRVQFSIQAARRHTGEPGKATEWHDRFVRHVAKGPWAEAAAGELWALGVGAKPRRVAGCKFTDERPTLDGQLDDACWKSQVPLMFADASGGSQAEYPTEAWLAYDAEFLYVAVRCKHPLGRWAPTVKARQRDANLDSYDRISLLIDLDRDYASYFRLEFDQRGCVREDCWGDTQWNPKWYVAANNTESMWTVEAAIPLGELTSSPVTLDTRWACNLVRIIPGKGVQSVSQPADVEPRPEGMCILHFHQDARRAATPMKSGE